MAIAYDQLIKEVRHRYEIKYNKVLDDEIIYLIIRINELELGIKKELKEINVETKERPTVPPEINIYEKNKKYYKKVIFIQSIITLALCLIMIIK